MSKEDWQALVEQFRPPDKQICNCRQAYYTLHPNGAWQGGKMVDSWQCAHGCSAAQIWAREHVAKCVRSGQ